MPPEMDILILRLIYLSNFPCRKDIWYSDDLGDNNLLYGYNWKLHQRHWNIQNLFRDLYFTNLSLKPKWLYFLLLYGYYWKFHQNHQHLFRYLYTDLHLQNYNSDYLKREKERENHYSNSKWLIKTHISHTYKVW